MRQEQDSEQNKRIRIHQAEDEVSIFKKEEKKHKKDISMILILSLVLIAVYFFSLLFLITYNSNTYSMAWISKYAQQNVKDFYDFVVGNGARDSIQFRVYRYLIIALSGASMAASGALFKGTFRNILAAPSTMGVQAGGTLGNTIYVLFFCTGAAGGAASVRYSDMQKAAYQAGLLGRNNQQFLVLLGCFLGVFLVVSIATAAGHGKISSSAMILSGMIFGSIIMSFSGIIQYYMILNNPEDNRIILIRNLTMGSFENAYTLEHLLMLAAVLVPCMVVTLCIRGKINVIALGEEEAAAMGLNVRFYKYLMIAVGTIMTAAVMAYCGQISFIGFMVPQAARKLAGPDFRKILPVSMLVGAILLIVIYDVALMVKMTDSINMITSTIGSLMMLFILIGKRGDEDAVITR